MMRANTLLTTKLRFFENLSKKKDSLPKHDDVDDAKVHQIQAERKFRESNNQSFSARKSTTRGASSAKQENRREKDE